MKSLTGLYIHIPLCLKKCLYCDFDSFVDMEDMAEPYLEAVFCEVKNWKEKFSPSYKTYKPNIPCTLFIGGGTPTCLSPQMLDKLFEGIYSIFQKKQFKEITIEANPETITKEKALLLKKYTSRVSIGAQSFNDKHLKTLGRIHSSDKIKQAVKLLRAAGVKNLNIDIMYGLPEQTLTQALEDLKQAIALRPKHISFYMLTAYEATPYMELLNKGKMSLPPDELIADMYLEGIKVLKKAGYKQYEISNFSKSGFTCLHNLNYWNMGEYAAAGSSAASFFKGTRCTNVSAPKEYIARIKAGKSPAQETDKYDNEKYMKDFIMLALRKTTGLSYKPFKQFFKIDFYQRYSKIIGDLVQAGYAVNSKTYLRLTPKGFLISNEIIQRLV